MITSFIVTSAALLITRPNLAHVQASRTLQGSCLALRGSRTPFLLDVRDRYGGARFHRYSTLVAGCSLGIIRDLRAAGARNPIHIPVIVSVEQMKAAFVEETCNRLDLSLPYILYLGVLSKGKGVERLIRAFAIVSERLPGYHLVFAGRNIEGFRFTSSMLRYLGEIPHKTAMAVLSKSSLLVLPSETEGIPTVCLEALALQRKVVFPPDVEEFSQLEPFALKQLDPLHIADVVERALLIDEVPSYDLSQHDPERVATLFWECYLRLTAPK